MTHEQDDTDHAWFAQEQSEARRMDDLTDVLSDIASTRIDDAWMARAEALKRSLRELRSDIEQFEIEAKENRRARHNRASAAE